jgi:hypothetical protein
MVEICPGSVCFATRLARKQPDRFRTNYGRHSELILRPTWVKQGQYGLREQRADLLRWNQLPYATREIPCSAKEGATLQDTGMAPRPLDMS